MPILIFRLSDEESLEDLVFGGYLDYTYLFQFFHSMEGKVKVSCYCDA